jgi:hypothetical protein
MYSIFEFSPVCWIHSLLAIVALITLGQPAGRAQGYRSGAQSMPRPMQPGRMSPYGTNSSYGGTAGYGGAQGYMGDYQSNAQAAPSASQGYTVDSQLSPEERSLARLLTASGVPNDNGHLRWPLGLRILAAPESRELRERIDALFEEAASEAGAGPVAASLIQETDGAIGKFRRLLLKDKTERLGMPLSVYAESERFLDRIQHAEQVLKPGLQVPGQQGPLKTTAPSTSYPSPPPEKK